jgi:cellulose synthase operon protein C
MKRAFATLLLAAALMAGCAKDFDAVTGVAEARTLLAQGKAGEARILLKNLLSKHPQTASARVLLAQIALDEGDPRAASDEISTLGDAALKDVEAQKVFVRVEIETGKPEAALKRLQASGELIPQPDRALLMASAYRALETPADALAVLREAQAVKGSSEPLILGIAETLAVMGNFELAEAELDGYLSGNPPDRANALRMRAEVKLRQGKPDDAVTDFRAALEAAPAGWPSVNRITTELMVADALISAGDIDAAKKQLEKVEKTSPGTFGVSVLQGQIALLEGRPDEAVERLESVTASGASNPRIQYLLVEALMKSGNTARASELLEELVATEPRSSPSRRVLAVMFMQQGRPDRVIEILGDDAEISLSDSGNNDDELLVAARLARANAAQAISTLSGKLAASPSDSGLRAELAAAQLANGEPAAALNTLGAIVQGKQNALAVATRLSAHYVTGNNIEANRVVDLLLTGSGADVPVLLAAADAAAQRQQNATVSRLLQRALTLAPADSEIQIRRASLAFTERKYDDAKSILKEMLKLEPGNVGAQLALARVSEAQGDVAGSRLALEAAIKAQPSAIEPSLMLASLELRASRVEAASKALDRLIEKNMDPGAPNAAGLLLARAGRYEEARTRFRQAIDRQPANAEYWFNLGEAQLAQKDAVAARDSFLRSAALRPDSLPAGFAAVRLSIEQKDVRSARRVAEELVAKLPESSTSWLLLGEAHAAGGDVTGAAAHFAHAYSVRPSSLAATREFTARVAAGMQRPEEPLLKWLSREPTDAATRLLLSNFYLVGSKYEQAREQLEIIVKQEPNDVAALNNLAWVLRTTAPERAETLARRARNIAPENFAVTDTLGVILLANGKTDEAVATLQKAAAGLPDDPNVQYHYAMSLSRAGEKEKARGVLDRALQNQRDFAERESARKLFKELG